MRGFTTIFFLTATVLTITLACSVGFTGGNHCIIDNVLIKEWQFLKEKNEVESELRNIMEVLDEYYSQKSLEFREELAYFIQMVCIKNNLDPALLLAVIFTESAFEECALSNRGAVGLMQLLPTTGYAMSKELQIEWKGHETLYNVKNNIRMGAYYLKKLLKMFNNLDMALTAYNAGPTRVIRYSRTGRTYSQTYAKTVSKHCKMFMNNYFRIES